MSLLGADYGSQMSIALREDHNLAPVNSSRASGLPFLATNGVTSGDSVRVPHKVLPSSFRLLRTVVKIK